MHLSLRKVVSAAAAGGLAGFTSYSASIHGFCSDPTVCGIGLLSVYAVIELTIHSYAATPDTRACAMRMIPHGRPLARGAFRPAREQPPRSLHRGQAA